MSDTGRQAPNVRGAQHLQRHVIGALFGHPGRSLAPGVRVQRHAQAPAAAIAGGALQLTIELGPSRQARQRQRAFGRIATHDANSGRARAGRGGAHLRSLEHRHPHAGVGTAKMKRRAQPHQSAAHDHDRDRHGRSLSHRL